MTGRSSRMQSLIEGGNSDLEAELRYYIGESNFYKGDYQQAILEFLKVPYLVTQRGLKWTGSRRRIICAVNRMKKCPNTIRP